MKTNLKKRPSAFVMETYLVAAARAYRAEVEAFAEELRPRFENRELYGPRKARAPGFEFLQLLCRERFGLQIVDGGPAFMVLACSRTTPAQPGGWRHPADQAADAVAWDVLRVAQARGWYRPTRQDLPDPVVGFYGPAGVGV